MARVRCAPILSAALALTAACGDSSEGDLGTNAGNAGLSAGTSAPATAGTTATAGTGVMTTAGISAGAAAGVAAPAGTGAAGMPANGGTGAMAGSGGGTMAGSMASAGTGAMAGTAAEAGTEAGVGGMGAPMTRPPATSLDFEIAEMLITDEPVFKLRLPADPDETGWLLPVIVWANGGCFRSEFTWAPLFERWARAGFAVLSLSVEDEDDLFMQLSQTSVGDHGELIDWVVAQNESGPYAGKLDLDRIVVAGNSCGGVTALGVAAEDERAAAVFVLSGSSAVGSVNRSVMGAISVPVGYIVGGSEDIASGAANGDYEAMADGVAGMVVSRFEGDHQTVSTEPEILPEVAEIALNWMDLAIYGTSEAYDALNSSDVCGGCAPGHWSLQSKHRDSLIK